MAALYTKRPNWPSGERLSRQYVVFTNEGWQLKAGNELSGLEPSSENTTLIAEPNRLTNFITDADGIYPSTVGDNESEIAAVFNKLISWIGFVDENGKEIPPGHTRSRGAGGVVHIDIVFITEVAFRAIPIISYIEFSRDLSTSSIFIEGGAGIFTLVGNSPTNVLRMAVNIGASVFGTNDVYRLDTSVAALRLGGANHITTVAEPGHTSTDLFPTPTGVITIPLSAGAYTGASSLTMVS